MRILGKNDAAFYPCREGEGSLARTHRHFDMQRFVAAAGAHATHWRRGQVVAADRETAMALACEHAMRDVHAHPAFASDPDVGPGVARGLLLVSGVDVAAHIARRHPLRAATGDEEMGVVLAHAAAELERTRGGARHFGDPAFVFHRPADRPGE